MFSACLIVYLDRWLVNADVLRFNDVPNLWATRKHVRRFHSRQGDVKERTDALLEGEQVILSEGIRFGDDRDEVDAGTETLHDLNVERLETKTGSDEASG
jgi:hypothetical protein